MNLTSAVRFSSAVATLLSQDSKDGLFLEVGPHSTLAGPLRQVCAAASRPCRYVPSMTRGRDCAEAFLSALGGLYQEMWLSTSALCSRAVRSWPVCPPIRGITAPHSGTRAALRGVAETGVRAPQHSGLACARDARYGAAVA